jgi:hypothetical protein
LIYEPPLLVFKFGEFREGLIVGENIIGLDPRYSEERMMPIPQDRVLPMTDRFGPIKWPVKHIIQGQDEVVKAAQRERNFREVMRTGLRGRFNTNEAEWLRFFKEHDMDIYTDITYETRITSSSN